ncbi:hypothetical protein CVS40_6972 [Lucilia cuprina]|nr:hypothetical protein CVS40_6972 [Lucilia cuprina]
MDSDYLIGVYKTHFYNFPLHGFTGVMFTASHQSTADCITKTIVLNVSNGKRSACTISASIISMECSCCSCWSCSYQHQCM